MNRHAPRKRGIQYSRALEMISIVAEYWVARSSRAMTAVLPLPSPEQLLDIRQLQFHISGPAVIALAGIRRVFHFA